MLIDKGGISVDDRGTLSYINTVPFEKVRRMYVIENFDADLVRAFHGHWQEEKFVYVVTGAAIVVTAKMVGQGLDMYERFVLSDKQPQVLRIPAGYANGFRVLVPGTKVIFYSTTTLEEAKSDDFRFPYDYFGVDIWKVESR